MFVSHFNTLIDGGAATAARRLHHELCSLGVDSSFYHAAKPDENEIPNYHRAEWFRDSPWRRTLSSIRYRLYRESFKRAVRAKRTENEIFTSPKAPSATPWPPLSHQLANKSSKGDSKGIVHLHWIAKLIDYESFFRSLDSQQPVVWTLHDMNAFTGGCHFAGSCENFKTGCGNCPQIARRSGTDVSQQSFAMKQQALQGINLHVVAPSRWLLDTASTSLMFQNAKSFTHIPYGIPTTDLYPMDRLEARARLGIDPGATIVGFGAMDVKSRRKGAPELTKALSSLADLPNVQCLVFGSGQLSETTLPLPPIHEVGAISGTLQQRMVYSACDVFVLPSLDDNLPLTGLEAMACGAPVVGFAAGGIPDYVRPGVSGALVKAGDAIELGQTLRLLLVDPERLERLGQGARRIIETEFYSKREAESYQRLYAALLDEAVVERRRAA